MMNYELCFDGRILNGADKIIEEAIKEENAHIKKLSFIHFKEGIISTVANHLPAFNLESLFLCNATISSEDARALANFIGRSQISKIKIVQRWIDDSALILMLNSINGSFLKKINLANRINMRRAESIVNLIERSCLIELSFDGSRFETGTLPLILAAVNRASNKAALQTLILKNSRFLCEDATAIIDTINGSNTLTKLSLVNVQFTITHDLQVAMKEAMHNPSLQNLNIIGTLFWDVTRTGPLFADDSILKLVASPNIKRFRCNNGFRSEEIVDAIKQNPSLECIHIDRASIEGYPLDKMCDLIENSSLIKLSLDYHDLDHVALHKIICSIMRSSIVSLCLISNFSTPNIVRIMRDLLENHCLIKLDLQLSYMTNAMVQTLLPAIKTSALIYFNSRHSQLLDADTKAEIRVALNTQRQILTRFSTTKGARTRQ